MCARCFNFATMSTIFSLELWNCFKSDSYLLFVFFTDPFKDSFAILPDVTHSKLFQVALSDGEIRALDIPDIDVPMSAIFDKPTDKIYWTNALTSEIRASTLKSTTSELIYTTCT